MKKSVLLFVETMDEPERIFMENFYLQYRSLLYAAALRYTSQKEAAEDLVHDALVQLVRHVTTLQTLSPNALAMYGVSTLKRVSINWLRRNQRVVPWADDLAPDNSGNTEILTPEDIFLLKERQQELLACISVLREEDRMLLIGKYILHQSDAELAQVFGCQAASVRAKLSRARRRARKELTKEVVYE